MRNLRAVVNETGGEVSNLADAVLLRPDLLLDD